MSYPPSFTSSLSKSNLLRCYLCLRAGSALCTAGVDGLVGSHGGIPAFSHIEQVQIHHFIRLFIARDYRECLLVLCSAIASSQAVFQIPRASYPQLGDGWPGLLPSFCYTSPDSVAFTPKAKTLVGSHWLSLHLVVCVALPLLGSCGTSVSHEVFISKKLQRGADTQILALKDT